MSWYIPGHLGPGTLGPNTASSFGTSQDVRVYPRTSWTWDSGTLPCLQSWDILGCHRDVPGHLRPGTRGPCPASTAGTSWVVRGCPRASWTWDSGTLPCLPSWDILGCPGMSQDILDVRDSLWQSWTTLDKLLPVISTCKGQFTFVYCVMNKILLAFISSYKQRDEYHHITNPSR